MILPLTRWARSGYAYVKEIRQIRDIQGLNEALQMYRIQGGMSYAHSLRGPNNYQKKHAVLRALEEGFVSNGQRKAFINKIETLDPDEIEIAGQGYNFKFKLKKNQLDE